MLRPEEWVVLFVFMLVLLAFGQFVLDVLMIIAGYGS